MGDNGTVSSTEDTASTLDTTGVHAPSAQDPEVQQRLERRYPPDRISRPVKITATVAFAAIALAWLVWAALFHSNPPVGAQVSEFAVVDAGEITATLVVDRPDPSVAVTCQVYAEAVDYERVGEKVVHVGPGTETVERITVSVRTFRQAASVGTTGCTVD